MRSLIGVALALCGSTAFAEDAAPQSAAVGAAIDRGLAFLAKDALAWKAEHNCASCHHAAFVVWAMREARLRGHAVDEPVLAEMTKWLAESGDGKTGVPRPDGIPKALNTKPVYFALGLEADPQPDDAVQAGLKLFFSTIKGDQLENGSWAAWPDTRPPIFGKSDESMTALATLALLPAAATDDTAKAAIDRAIQWLTETKTDNDPQSVAMRLVLWRRMGRPAEEWEPLARLIRERQNADGGWSQAQEMASDAWATGQALYALAHAGIKAPDPPVVRAREFLVRTQRDDGSWPMTSRPTKPGDLGCKSLVPITGAGSAWAILGLVRSAASSTQAAVPNPAVSLILSKATVERHAPDILFRCEVVLDNATGRDLSVQSNFSSILFDGLELVVTTKDGKTLAQQPYVYHQAPFSPDGRKGTLKQGSTPRTLVFPIRDLPGDAMTVKVRLVGHLPGSDYRRILSTETIEVDLQAKE